MPSAPDRLPPIPPEALTSEQQRAADALAQGPRGALFGPFIPMLRSPELLDRAQRLGAYLRYDSAVAPRLRELAILVTARHYRQSYEWHVHAPAAVQAGLAEKSLEALVRGERPATLQPDEAAVYDFCGELLETHGVGDETYAAVRALLGERGLVDLCALCGYYGLLALIMNVARTPLPQGTQPNWPT